MFLHQIQIVYQADEDRLMLRISINGNEDSLQEIRAWLPRRLVKTLWPRLIEAMETQILLDHPEAAHARAEIVGMKHQAAIDESRSRGSYGHPFTQEIDNLPFGEKPILLVQINIAIEAKQAPRINFVSAQGNFEIAFTSNMFHGFCTLLQDAVKTSDWDIGLNLPGIRMADMKEDRVLN